MGVRRNGNMSEIKEYPKGEYKAKHEDIYWPEMDKMRSDVNKMWDLLNRKQKRNLKKKLKSNV